MSYLFKHNLTLKAKAQYTGNWIIASQIFPLYEHLIDIRNKRSLENLTITELNPYKTDFLRLWITTYREHLKHLNLDRELILKITTNLKLIAPIYKNNYYKINMSNILKLTKFSKYKELVLNLIQYMTSFFKELGIPTKPIKTTSEISGRTIYAITPNLSLGEEFIEEQTNINTTIQDKILEKVKEKYARTGKGLFINSLGIYEVKSLSGEPPLRGYIIPGEWNTLYPISELDTIKKKLHKDELISNNYNKFTYKDGYLLSPKGNPIKELDYLSPKELNKKILDYQVILNNYNFSLQPYETPLYNEPFTITLGDHTLTVQKVFYNNITRPIVIEGKYKGLFLDQMVSPNSQVIESVNEASAYFSQSKELYESVIDSKYIKPKDALNIEHAVVLNRVKDYTPRIDLTKTQFTEVNEYGAPIYTIANGEKKIFLDELKVKAQVKEELPKLSGLSILGDSFPGLDSRHLRVHIDKSQGDTILKITVNKSDLNIVKKIKIDRYGRPDYIENENVFTPNCIPEGLGTKLFTQQVKSASNLKFNSIHLFAAGAYGSPIVGYYVWPKFGFNNTIEPVRSQTIQEMKDKSPKEFELVQKWFDQVLGVDNLMITTSWNLLDLYACKVNGKFLGQQLWLKYGETMNLSFDLTPGSLSMRIFDRYVQLKAKKEGVSVEDFLNVNYSKFSKNLNLSCIVNNINNLNRQEIIDAINNAIANHENGDILNLLKRPDIIKRLQSFRILDDNTYSQLKSLAKTYRTDLNFKFASISKDTIQEDPMLKELDMDILTQIWNDINKEYVG